MAENSEKIVKRTIVELDLVGYSDIARHLEEHLGANAVMQLNKQVQSFVNEGLLAVKIPLGDAVSNKAGDNALVVFETASEAHRFAEAFHRITEQYNAAKTETSAERHFRLGISTGCIAIEGDEIAGTAIIDSCRLEAGGDKGHILICADTYRELPEEYRNSYVGPEILKDKRGKEHQVYRYAVVAKEPLTLSARGQDLYGRLKLLTARNKKSCTLTAYGVLAVVILAAVFFLSAPMRRTAAVNASVTAFLNSIRTGEYTKAYSQLSRASQRAYPLPDFAGDHSASHTNIQDFKIVQVSLNSMDRNRAFARISSSSRLYGQRKLRLELTREDGAWNVVFSRNIVAAKPPSSSIKSKVNNFFKAL